VGLVEGGLAIIGQINLSVSPMGMLLGLLSRTKSVPKLKFPNIYTDLKTKLKGVFVKNERGYRVNAIKKRF